MKEENITQLDLFYWTLEHEKMVFIQMSYIFHKVCVHYNVVLINSEESETILNPTTCK